MIENPGQGPLLNVTQATHFHFEDALDLLAAEKLIRFNKRHGSKLKYMRNITFLRINTCSIPAS